MGRGGVSEACDKEVGAGWKCGGGWEARDGWNWVGRDAGKGTCMPGATPGIYGGKKGIRWRNSDNDVPIYSDLHTYSWPRILVHKKYNYTNLSHQN